jgi:guanylate kinase
MAARGSRGRKVWAGRQRRVQRRLRTREVESPEALQRELGGSVQDMMARNVSADWYVVGSHLEERTRRVEELIQKAQ